MLGIKKSTLILYLSLKQTVTGQLVAEKRIQEEREETFWLAVAEGLIGNCQAPIKRHGGGRMWHRKITNLMAVRKQEECRRNVAFKNIILGT